MAVCQAGKKPDAVLPTVIVFLLHASRFRPALDNFRKCVSLHAGWLNTFRTFCTLNCLAYFPNPVVIACQFGLVFIYLSSYPVHSWSFCDCQLYLSFYHPKENTKLNTQADFDFY